MVQEEIRKKTLLKNRTAADLSWKKKEISFVGDTITDFRKGLHQREVDAAQTARRGRTAILTETRGIGEEMRAQQTFREKDMFAMSEFDLAERTRRNQEGAKQQTLTLSALFASMEVPAPSSPPLLLSTSSSPCLLPFFSRSPPFSCSPLLTVRCCHAEAGG